MIDNLSYSVTPLLHPTIAHIFDPLLIFQLIFESWSVWLFWRLDISLVGWLVVWLFNWWAGILFDCFIDWLFHDRAGSLIVWEPACLSDCLGG